MYIDVVVVVVVVLRLVIRGVARDKTMYRHHYSRGVRGHAASEKCGILYRRSCILEHFMAYFEGFLCILQRLPRRFFFNVNSPHKKIKSKIIENLPFCIQDIFYHMGVAMACTRYTLSC